MGEIEREREKAISLDDLFTDKKPYSQGDQSIYVEMDMQRKASVFLLWLCIS